MEVEVPLDRPPEVVAAGVGVHGLVRRQDRFRLPDLWAFHLYRYDAVLELDGEPHPVAPGSVSLVPPGVVTVYRYRGVSEHLFAHLRLPGRSRLSLPAVVDAGPQVAGLTDLLLGAVTASPSAPAQASAHVWSALWRVATLGGPVRSDPARARLAPVLAHVEAHLADPLPVPELAALAGVSPTHLTRLFRAALGDTAVGYVRQRRMAQAEHLLRHTTLPVQTIARSVGIADLQAFNKACRATFGSGPRSLRSKSTNRSS